MGPAGTYVSSIHMTDGGSAVTAALAAPPVSTTSSIPLGPNSVLIVSEVERIHNPTSLPTIVFRRDRTVRRVQSSRDMTQPPSLDAGRIDLERQAAYAAPGDSRSLISLATSRARRRAMSSIGVRSSRASTGFTNQTGMYAGSMTRARRSTISASSTTRCARSPIGDARPRSQSRTVLGLAPTASPITTSERWATRWIRMASSASAEAMHPTVRSTSRLHHDFGRCHRAQ